MDDNNRNHYVYLTESSSYESEDESYEQIAPDSPRIDSDAAFVESMNVSTSGDESGLAEDRSTIIVFNRPFFPEV